MACGAGADELDNFVGAFRHDAVLQKNKYRMLYGRGSMTIINTKCLSFFRRSAED